MNKTSFLIWMSGLTLIALLLAPYTYEISGIIFLKSGVSVWEQLSLYQWAATGFIIYCIVHKYVNLNINWLEVKSHEEIHAFVGWFFSRRIHSSHAEEESGVVYTSGDNFWNRFGIIPMALAPYCLPLWTYFILWLRPFINFQGRGIFDIVIGLTVAFHVLCFKSQTRNNQTDINQYPLLFSYSYIYIARIINGLIIVVAFFPQSKTVSYPVLRLINAMVDNAIMYINMVL